MRVLVTGANGQVGKALVNSALPGTEMLALTRTQLDIIDSHAVHRAVSAFQPDLIINAAAYTAVDKAESEPKLADAINREAPRYLAEAASAVPDCRLVQLSTDYVFDGDTQVPYRPDAPTGPLSVYGSTKAAGERAVLEVLGSQAIILRTAWVYAAHGRNFLLTMLRMMNEQNAVRVVADQQGTPTAASSVARALWRLAELPAIQGTLHWTDDGVATWYHFAQAIAKEARAFGLLSRAVEIVPITTAQYPTAARRPMYSVLDCHETAEKLGLRPVPWVESLREAMRELAGRGG